MSLQVKTSTLNSEYLKLTKDESTANQSDGQMRMQHFYTFLLSQAENYTLEKTKYADLKATQRSYLMFPDYQRMKNIRVKDGDTWYPLKEVTSLDMWNDLIQYDRTSNIVEHYIIRNESGQLYVEFDPIPNTDVDDGIEFVYEGYHEPLKWPAVYDTGTITVTQGSATVTGSGTTFTSAMVGRFIKVDKWWYEIKAVDSTTELRLVNYYQEASGSGQAYEIAELLRLPPEFSYTPLYGALEEYWRPKNSQLADSYATKYARELLILQKKYKSKSTGSVIPGTRVGDRDLGRVPRNYPTSAIG